MKHTPLVVLDLETTGLSPYSSKITEIAAVRLLNGKIKDHFETLVNPGIPIPRFITRLTGITDSMVKDAPVIEDTLKPLKSFLGDDVFVGHNVGFDYKFVSHNFWAHQKKVMSNDTLCTAKLARRVHSELPSKRLGAVCDVYNVENEAAHRAMGDVNATVAILQGMLKRLEEKQITKFNDVKAFEKMPVWKANRLLNGPEQEF